MRWLLLEPPFIQMNQVLELKETEKLSQFHTASKWQSQIRNFSVCLQSLGFSCSQEALRDSLFSAYHVTPTFLGTVVLSRVQLFVTPWTVAHQALLSMDFSRQEYWSGLLFPSPRDLPDPGKEPGSPTLQGSLPSEPSREELGNTKSGK